MCTSIGGDVSSEKGALSDVVGALSNVVFTLSQPAWPAAAVWLHHPVKWSSPGFVVSSLPSVGSTTHIEGPSSKSHLSQSLPGECSAFYLLSL